MVGSTVPVSQNTTARSMSSAVMGNMYSAEASNWKSPPMKTFWPVAGPTSVGDAPRNWKPRRLEKPPAIVALVDGRVVTRVAGRVTRLNTWRPEPSGRS